MTTVLELEGPRASQVWVRRRTERFIFDDERALPVRWSFRSIYRAGARGLYAVTLGNRTFRSHYKPPATINGQSLRFLTRPEPESRT